MAFPFTHLCAAYEILKKRPLPERDAAQFMLGSIAPDAIHYRAAFRGAAMANIGPAKKITHLCPVSDEKWGAVTDNDGWVKCVESFVRRHPKSPLAAGYAVHILTDICNNKSLWENYRTNYPDEAAKGYTSDYYRDLRSIDTRLYRELPDTPNIMELLKKGEAADMPELVSANEIRAIQTNLLYEHFKNAAEPAVDYAFVTYSDMLNFIGKAADFSARFV